MSSDNLANIAALLFEEADSRYLDPFSPDPFHEGVEKIDQHFVSWSEDLEVLNLDVILGVFAESGSEHVALSHAYGSSKRCPEKHHSHCAIVNVRPKFRVPFCVHEGLGTISAKRPQVQDANLQDGQTSKAVRDEDDWATRAFLPDV